MDFLSNFDLGDEEANEKTASAGDCRREFVPKEKASRTGYRPVLVAETCLKKEAAELGEKMLELNRLYADNVLNGQDTSSFYILLYLNHRYPSKFLGSLNPIYELEPQNRPPSSDYRNYLQVTNAKIRQRLESSNVASFFEILNNFNLHCVPHSARVAMVEWYMGNYHLVFMLNSFPAAHKHILEMQADYKRCLSLISDPIDRLVFGKRDPLSFLLHDLVHAYKMFSNERLLRGQVGFCRAMLRVLANEDASAQLNRLKQDTEFADAFDYLISDMNSDPKHLFFYFKAILINAFKKRYNEKVFTGEKLREFQQLFEVFITLFGMDEPTKEVARKLFIYDSDGGSGAISLDEIRLDQREKAAIFDDFFISLA